MSSHNSTPSTAVAVAQASGALGVSTQPLYDFSNMPVTLEQQIADTLVRIEALLKDHLQKPAVFVGSQGVTTPVKPSPEEMASARSAQIAALAAKSGTRRK